MKRKRLLTDDHTYSSPMDALVSGMLDEEVILKSAHTIENKLIPLVTRLQRVVLSSLETIRDEDDVMANGFTMTSHGHRLHAALSRLDAALSAFDDIPLPVVMRDLETTIEMTCMAHPSKVLADASPDLDGRFAREIILCYLHRDEILATYITCKAFKRTIDSMLDSRAFPFGSKIPIPSTIYISTSESLMTWALDWGYKLKQDTLPHDTYAGVFANCPAGKESDCFNTVWKSKRLGTFSCAASVGCMPVLRLLLDRGCPWSGWTCAFAALEGHMEALQWLRAAGCPWGQHTCKATARIGGRLPLLKWLRASGCPWGKYTFDAAARRGDLEMLRWCKLNGCPIRDTACGAAAEGGHVEILDWMLDTNMHMNLELVMESGACMGHLNVVQWCYEKGVEIRDDLFLSAAFDGNLEMLQWATSIGCVWSEDILVQASCGGNLSVVQLVHGTGVPLSEAVMEAAAGYCHDSVIRWCIAMNCVTRQTSACAKAADCAKSSTQAIEILSLLVKAGCPWDPLTTRGLASAGHVEALKWAVSVGCALHEDCAKLIARTADIELVDWCLSNGNQLSESLTTAGAGCSPTDMVLFRWLLNRGCPLSGEACMRAAMGRGNTELIKWLVGAGVPIDPVMVYSTVHFEVLELALLYGCLPKDSRMCAEAAHRGDVKTLIWLYEKGCSIDHKTFFNAAQRGHFDVAHWCLSVNCPWNESVCQVAAVEGHLEMLQWLRENGCPWDASTITAAHKSGHDEVANWALAYGCK